MVTTMRARPMLMALGLGLLLVAACGDDTTEVATMASEPTSQTPGTSSAPSTVAPSETQAAVATLPAGHVLKALDGAARIDGSTFELASHPEDLPTVVWFWAPWCLPCREMAPDIAHLSAEYEGRLSIVGVAEQGEVARIVEFVADTGTDAVGHVIDADGTIWQRYGVTALPTLLFVTPDGEVDQVIGPQASDTMVERFDQLLTS